MVERITFQSPETGYTVARLLPDYPSPKSSSSASPNSTHPNQTTRFPTSISSTSSTQPNQRSFFKQAKGDDNLVTIVGTLTGVAPGEALELTGLWQQHPQHGWQFKVENYRSILPATTQGIRKYLGSGLIKGIGPKTAEKIVEHFDVETLDVLEENPQRLSEVPKLGQHKARLIAAAWLEQKAIKEVMIFLQGHSISTSLAVRIFKQYKDAAITIVKNEPYRLAREVWGIGFKTADKIAQALGFELDDPERIKAGTLFVLSEASDSGGHTYLPRPLLAVKAAELLGVSEEQVDQGITGLALDGGAQVETLLADPQDGTLSFEPLVAITFVKATHSPRVIHEIPSPYNANPSQSGSLQPKPEPRIKPGSEVGPPAEAAAAAGGLMDDLEEALRYSPNYKRIAATTAASHNKPAAADPHTEKGGAAAASSKPDEPKGRPVPVRAGVKAARISEAEVNEEVEEEEEGDRGGAVLMRGPGSKAIALSNSNGSTPTLSARPGEQAVYLPPFYYAEQGIAKQLLRLARSPRSKDALADLAHLDFRAMFDYLATRDTTKLELAPRQQEGVVMALVKPVGVITGGPGTGKTTSMRALIRALTLKKKRIILAAPTGRAAKRLSEATGLAAKTLHRLLQLKPGGKSQYDYKDHPLPADIVIVDEVSMLDTLLMYNLLKGIATGTHLLLVGDADQLPSVGAGNVLADIINSGEVPVVKLDQIFRQGAGSAIVSNAHRINQGQMPLMGRDITDFFFFQEEDPEKAGDLVVELVASRIPKRFSYPPQAIQVLAPMHRGKSGVGYLNEKLQEVLNPAGESKGQKQYGNKLFREGDKVLQLRNNYDKQVYNGDAGLIMDISQEDQTVKVRLEDEREVEYDFGELDELTLAYAISIHKSQGSEYEVAVIPVAMGHYMLLERKLIYTAITRAKKLVVLVGSKRALAMAVRNGPNTQDRDEGQNLKKEGGREETKQYRAGRYTGLTTRLSQLA